MTALELLYAATVFLSAFLLFQIQPMIAKMILPWFGGVSTVWSTCMLFFQVVLLLGYLYAHWLQNRIAPRRQPVLHSLMLAASLLALPVVANPAWKPAPGDNPSLRILGLLAVTVGLPYFVLSTTSSLIQSWYARTHHGAVPYRLFALSNFASLLALLTYPLVVEPAWTTRLQATVWSVAYGFFVVFCGCTAWLGSGLKNQAGLPSQADEETGPAPSLREKILWTVLAACASILLLAVTTFLTQDLAPIPFLWVLPLAIYLLSFIFCFNTPGFYSRPIFVPLVIAGLIAVATRIKPFGWKAGLIPTIAIFSAALFVFCMFCHGELVRRKPHPRHLTAFYVMISLGGAAGGLFVGLIAPNLFDFYYEFPIGLALCAALVMLLTPAPAIAWRQARDRKAWRPVLAVFFCGYSLYLGYVEREATHDYIDVRRNFYGQLRVRQDGDPEEEDSARILVHGRINHGQQMLNVKYRRTPSTYFCAASGVGKVMAARPAQPQRVGILGLGCGTLAAYGRRGDTFRIYEINPQVSELANSQFTFLKDSEAKIELILGDGRLSLEREPAQQYDLLVMDAFSGDSVPVHLLTTEALKTYFRHLKPGGLLLANVTNTFLNLSPVVERAAAGFGKIALRYRLKPNDEDLLCFSSGWVVIGDPSLREQSPDLFRAGELLQPQPGFRAWTDDYSSLWGILY
jgi:hypothetical protein